MWIRWHMKLTWESYWRNSIYCLLCIFDNKKRLSINLQLHSMDLQAIHFTNSRILDSCVTYQLAIWSDNSQIPKENLKRFLFHVNNFWYLFVNSASCKMNHWLLIPMIIFMDLESGDRNPDDLNKNFLFYELNNENYI